jgi:hypothetical protein
MACAARIYPSNIDMNGSVVPAWRGMSQMSKLDHVTSALRRQGAKHPFLHIPRIKCTNLVWSDLDFLFSIARQSITPGCNWHG